MLESHLCQCLFKWVIIIQLIGEIKMEEIISHTPKINIYLLIAAHVGHKQQFQWFKTDLIYREFNLDLFFLNMCFQSKLLLMVMLEALVLEEIQQWCFKRQSLGTYLLRLVVIIWLKILKILTWRKINAKLILKKVL